jgi:sugar lactone lactonase YvrE
VTVGVRPEYRRRVRKFALILLAVSAVGAACIDAGAKTKPKPIRVATPGPLALAPSGALVIGDRTLKRVVRIDLRTKRRVVLASGFPEAIVGVAYDDMGRLYVSSGERIYRIDGKRKVVVAGTGARGHSGDGGPATSAQLSGAGGFDVDHDESIAIAEYDNWIRVVDPGGSISTVAGNGGTGIAGDGGPALEALLGHPHDVVWRRDGVLVIADSHNGLLRRVDAAGKISTFASGLGAPIDIVGAPGDALYVADAQLGVLRVGPEGGTPAVIARVPGGIGITVDNGGNAYVSQLDARRVVRVTPAGRVTAVVTGR